MSRDRTTKILDMDDDLLDSIQNQMDPIPLFRNLLRQASVLYDDVARTYMKRYIKLRFKMNRKTVSGWRTTEQLKQGRRGLSLLIRANAGETKALLQVLKMGYGQTGRRKHELLEPIINQPPEVEPQPLVPGDSSSTPPAMSAALRALVVSQRESGIITITIKPKIPAINAWGRPLSKRREINMLWEHHSKLLDHVLPPLEPAELERLERLARGLETPKLPKRKVLTDLPIPKGAEPHNLTPRFKRRMWKRILVNSSTLKFDEEWKKWRATYSPFIKSPQTSVGELADFEGMLGERVGAKIGRSKSWRSKA